MKSPVIYVTTLSRGKSAERRPSPTKAFDKLAFRAVSKTFSDLQERGVLRITDEKDKQEYPLQLSPSIAKYFETDQQSGRRVRSVGEVRPYSPQSLVAGEEYPLKVEAPYESFYRVNNIFHCKPQEQIFLL